MTHTHTHNHNHNYGPSYSGTVMLDIGADAGALIIVTGPELVGREIEIGANVEGAARTHVAVRQRLLGDRTMYCAFYPKLAEGEYTIWGDDDRPVAAAQIKGGEITIVEDYQPAAEMAASRSTLSSLSVASES